MRFKYKLTAAFVGLALASLSGSVMAVSIQTASESGSLDGAAIAGVSQSSGLPGSVDVLDSFTGSANSTGFFHVYGSVFPGSVIFGSRTSGTGRYDLTGAYKLSQEFTTTGNASGTFSFVLDNGELSAFCSPCTGGGSALITIDIRVDGNPVVGGSGKGLLTVNEDGSTVLTHEGLVDSLGLPASGTPTPATSTLSLSYDWSPTPFSLALGALADGSHTLTYDLVTKATGNFLSDTLCYVAPGGEGGVIGVTAVGGGEGGCGLGNTTARSGDPQSANAAAAGLSVPEPGTLALLGLGLAGIGVRQRRKRSRHRGG